MSQKELSHIHILKRYKIRIWTSKHS